MSGQSRDIYYSQILPRVERPSRYIGRECNLLSGGYSQGKFNVLLAFPDTYEIGMSHQGLRLLYGVLSRMENVGVEFAFAPWPDMEKQLRQRGQPLRSLQTGTPAHHFDLLGISLTYELHYTNMLMMLELAGLPLPASRRGDDHPLVIAGGPCCMNPLPFLEALDAVFLGEAEDSLPLAVEKLMQLPGEIGRAERREALAGVKGVYIDGVTESATIRKHPLDDRRPEKVFILPSASVVHQRLSVEIQRGCTRGCRFCHAGVIYRPRRERSVEGIVEEVCRGLDSTGWDEVSLSSLSTSDYSCLGELLDRLTPLLEKRKVSLAMPSLRPETVTERLIRALSLIRRSGFTLAPEAGTERLRSFINKKMSDDEIVESCRKIIGYGWQKLKLYFMVGLPSEEREDLEGIVSLVRRILSLRRESGRFRLTVSLSPFAPKPHTPFQWERQCTIPQLEEKQEFIRRHLSGGGVEVSLRNPAMSVLEGIMARSGRELWPVLLKAYRRGCRFDGWGDQLKFDIWQDVLKQDGFDPNGAGRGFSPEKELPWDIFDSGMTRKYLLSERERAYRRQVTPDCSAGRCSGCGVCIGEEGYQPGRRIIFPSGEPEQRGAGGMPGEKHTETDREREQPIRFFRYRCIYKKTGRIRFLSHREIMNIFQRALRRSSLPLNYSSGFTPRPRISVGPPLPVGAEGIKEFFDVELTEPAGVTPAVLNPFLPRGLLIKKCQGAFTRKKGKLPPRALFVYRLNFEGIAGFEKNNSLHNPAYFTYRGIKEIIERGDRIRNRKGRSAEIGGCEVEWEGDRETVRLTLPSDNSGGVRPRDFLEKVIPERRKGVRVRRLALLYKIKENYYDPLEILERDDRR